MFISKETLFSLVKNGYFLSSSRLVLAQLSTQKLKIVRWHSCGIQELFSCLFSYSKAAPSQIEGSFGTPLGLHKIVEKIGHTVPAGGQFIHRKFTGRICPQAKNIQEKAAILTRILRLQGCEWGFNKGIDPLSRLCCDTYLRCIYIHGTNLEAFIPQRLSHGCLLLKTKDLVEMFNLLEINDFCFIYL